MGMGEKKTDNVQGWPQPGLDSFLACPPFTERLSFALKKFTRVVLSELRQPLTVRPIRVLPTQPLKVTLSVPVFPGFPVLKMTPA